MLRATEHNARPTPCGEDGFTLIELLVAMLCAMVVTGALFLILQVALHQTARVTGRTEATQLGRTTMTRIVDELHSSCIGKAVTPIRARSTATNLWFIAGVGTQAVPTEVYEHKISYSASEHSLTDETWASTGGIWPTLTFPETATMPTPAKKTRIGEYIYPTNESGGKPVIFQYYSYATSTNTANAVSTLNTEALKPETGEELGGNATKAAAVRIAFTASAPYYKQYNPTIELSSQVTFAFSVPSAETPIVAVPCE
jgi:Tfp pilus assembly protein PilV